MGYNTHHRKTEDDIGKENMARKAKNDTEEQVLDAPASEESRQTPVNLNGEFRFKIDDRGRVSLPSKFRQVLSKSLTVTRNPKDECLYVFEAPEFERWIIRVFEEKFGGYHDSDKMHVKLRRKLKARARDVEIDGSGRIVLTAELREAVGINKEVVLVGNTGYFEVWDAKRYDELDAEVDLSLLFG